MRHGDIRLENYPRTPSDSRIFGWGGGRRRNSVWTITCRVPRPCLEKSEAFQRCRRDHRKRMPRLFPDLTVVLFTAGGSISPFRHERPAGQEVTVLGADFIRRRRTINAFAAMPDAASVDVGVKNDLDNLWKNVRSKVMHAARDWRRPAANVKRRWPVCRWASTWPARRPPEA